MSSASYLNTRSSARAAFLDSHLPGASAPQLIGEDWGTRRYYRIDAQARSFILMESVPDHLPFAAPGHRVVDFLRLSDALREAGVHAPAVFSAQPEEGFVLMEDMGSVSFYTAMENGVEDEAALYALAVDGLRALETSFAGNRLALPLYADSHIHKGRRRIIDWYVPLMRGRMNEDGLAESYLDVWDAIERALPPCPEGFVHGDYHAQNLMWLPEESGLARCGILDFQGAMWGPLPYDLCNLLGDIRRDISPELEAAMMERRTAGMDNAAKDSFLAWYPVLKMQFHCRIIGQVIRLAHMGKAGHLRHMERLQRYIRGGLTLPVLTPLANWFRGEAIGFDAPPLFTPQAIESLVRPDAF